MFRRALALVAAMVALAGGAASAEPVKTERLEVELAPQLAAATPGSTIYVAVRHEIADGWHTYWKNSGDSGLATEIEWTLPAGWRAGEIVWPLPERQRVAHMMNYGYTGEVFLPVPIQVPANARPGETVRIEALAKFLVCSDICIPEDARVSLSLPVREGEAGLHPRFGRAVSATLERAPKAAGLTARAEFDGGRIRLGVEGAPLDGVDPKGAYFFPYDPKLIVHPAVQRVERGARGVTLSMEPATEVAVLNAPIEGVLALPDGRGWEVRAEPGPIPAGAQGLGAVADADRVPWTRAAGVERDPDAPSGVLSALLFAFLGGLILNLMPCVFPVLSMKAAALAGAAERPATARRDGLLFLAGVLASFLVLAGALIALRAAGEAVGWGFQLQSPGITAALSLLMLAIALNLSGVFEVAGGLQGAGSGLSARRDALGAFFTGVLAVVVAAPCTAPFMAGAIGFALTLDAWAALSIFAALGFGLAAPFVALSFSPALLKRLPRPGPWMEAFRRLLAFPMFGAAAWMLWVFAQQSGEAGLAALMAAGLVLAFGLHLYGRWQRRRVEGVPGRARLAVAILALLSAVGLAVAGARAGPSEETAAQTAVVADLQARPWSRERVAALRAEGRPVFVNFTAAWCVSCKVNERVALRTPGVRDALTRTGAVYLEADWTRRDAEIARALAEHGRSGVPLYLVYAPGSDAPEVLPQLLTEGMVVAALERAAGKR